MPIFRIALAGFAAINQLAAKAGNVYLQTDQSGKYSLNSANKSGMGSIKAQVLEESTVDLSKQLTNLMAIQQNWTANSRAISVYGKLQDTLLQDVR